MSFSKKLKKNLKWGDCISGEKLSVFILCVCLSFAVAFMAGCTSEYQVDTQPDMEEAGKVTGDGTYQEGKKVMVTAQAKEGYEFNRWKEDNQEVSSDSSYEFEIQGDRKLTAEFDRVDQVTVKAEPDQEEAGSVTGDGRHPKGEEVTLTAEPREGHEFLYWEKDGMMRGRDKELDIRTDSDKVLTAHFSMEVAEGVMPPEFVFDLYHQVASPEDNTFMSPVSVYLALTLLYNGAHGETREEIDELLHAHNMTMEEFNEKCADFREYLEKGTEGIELSLADSLWMEEGIEFSDDYLKKIDEYHDAEAKEIDFADPEAPAKVNKWVLEETEEMIEELFVEGEPMPAEIFILLNAIYFQGQWMEEFDPDETEKKDFILDDGSTTEVSMMQRESEEIDEYRHLDGEGFEGVRIPYGEDGNRMGMYVFVPDDGLEDFYSRLKSDNWKDWMNSFTPKQGKIGLPRFEIEHESILTEPLREMGMEKAFQREEADFSAMVPDAEGLFLDEIKHKAVVKVDEKGTEAAAVTAALGMGDAPEPFEVIADRPFFFAIRDDEGESILFAGAVVDPNAN